MAKENRGIDSLNLRASLLRFFTETSSATFFSENLIRYNDMVSRFMSEFDGSVVGRLEVLFGIDMSKDRFEIVLSPMFAGGQAVEIENLNTTQTHVCIVNPYYAAESVDYIVLHEIAHNFLAHVFKKYENRLLPYSQYLKEAFGNPPGYVKNNTESLLNEILARVITILFEEEQGDPERAVEIWLEEKEQGWENLETVHALVKNRYVEHRETYPSFADFFPVILEYFKAKNLGLQFDIGPVRLKEPDVREIREVRVVGAYLPSDPQLEGLHPEYPDSIFLEVEYSPLKRPSSGDQIGAFLEKAGSLFELTAPDMPTVSVGIYQGGMFTVERRQLQGFWAAVKDGKAEPGMPDTLVPKKGDPVYRWIIPEALRIRFPITN